MKKYFPLKKIGQKNNIIAYLFVTSVLISGCGSGSVNSNSDKENSVFSETENTRVSVNINISGKLSDTPVQAKPILEKVGEEREDFHHYKVGTWADTVIQAIDSSGNVIASTTADSSGNFSLSVSPGHNYFLRASLGNLVLKAFIENATFHLRNEIIDPTSSAIVKVLCLVLGDPNSGGPRVDISTSGGLVDIGSTISEIKSINNFPLLVDSITAEIANYYSLNESAPEVGTAGDSGATIVSEIFNVLVGNQKAVTAFSLDGVPGTIDEAAETISVVMPFGTDVAALIATFTTSGSSVRVGETNQTSGTTSNDFTSSITYTVTAADASKAAYVVTVDVTAEEIDHLSVIGACSGCHTKPTGHISTDNMCQACHSLQGWINISMDHGSANGTCSSCHAKPDIHVLTSNPCEDCHSPTRWLNV